MSERDRILERLRILEALREAEEQRQPKISAQPSTATREDLPGAQAAEALRQEQEDIARMGPVSRGMNLLTGSRQALLPKDIETGFVSAIMTALPTAKATTVAQRYVKEFPKASRYFPVLVEMASDFFARRAMVAGGFEKPGLSQDLLALAAPGMSKGLFATGRAVGRGFVPPVTQEAGEALARGGTREAIETAAERALKHPGADVADPTAFVRGERFREIAHASEEEFGQVTNEAFDIVRNKIKAHIGNEPIDITKIDKLARSLALPLNRIGVEVTRQPAQAGQKLFDATGREITVGARPARIMATIDDLMRISSRTRGSIESAGSDRIKAAALRRIRTAIDDVIKQRAKDAGALADLQAARSFFAQEIVPRFRTRTARRMLDEVQTSAERIVTRAPSMSVQEAIQLERMVAQAPERFVPGVRAVITKREALHELHSGSIAAILKRSVNAQSGQIQPGQLLTTLKNMEPEARRILFGGESAAALMEFARKLNDARNRVSLGVGVSSLASLSLAGGQAAGGIGAAAPIEALNELTLLGRLFAGNPIVSKRLLRGVLNEERSAIRDFTALTGLRIFGTQVGELGLEEALPDIEESTTMGAEAPPFPDTLGAPFLQQR